MFIFYCCVVTSAVVNFFLALKKRAEEATPYIYNGIWSHLYLRWSTVAKENFRIIQTSYYIDNVFTLFVSIEQKHYIGFIFFRSSEAWSLRDFYFIVFQNSLFFSNFFDYFCVFGIVHTLNIFAGSYRLLYRANESTKLSDKSCR